MVKKNSLLKARGYSAAEKMPAAASKILFVNSKKTVAMAVSKMYEYSERLVKNYNKAARVKNRAQSKLAKFAPKKQGACKSESTPNIIAAVTAAEKGKAAKSKTNTTSDKLK